VESSVYHLLIHVLITSIVSHCIVQVSDRLGGQVAAVGKLPSLLTLFIRLVLAFKRDSSLLGLVPALAGSLRFETALKKGINTTLTFRIRSFTTAKLFDNLASKVIIKGEISVFRLFENPARFFLVHIRAVISDFKLLGRLNHRAKHVKGGVAHVEHLYIVGMTFQYVENNLERFLIVGRQKVQSFTRAADTCSTTTAMNVDFRVEGALIMEYVVYVGDVEAASCDIGAY
jgi:hypothetical protein